MDGEPVSQQPMHRCFQWMACFNGCFQWTVQDKVRIKYPVNRGRSEHDVQNIGSHYHVEKWRLAGFEDRTQQLGIRNQKCTNLRSNYRRSVLQMSMSCTNGFQILTPGTGLLCQYQI
ncbi:hypothetical protein TNCV_1500371 [Trichonephila clavipes]|nr:hypothetical protein TNCV_1500371 [Trichonephila clavipes]